MNTDYAIATTGNAGPKGDDNAEIGLFYCLLRPMRLLLKYNFGQPRDKDR
jgi:nicotinamide mononucleotide (NMN) deamidase PncC